MTMSPERGPLILTIQPYSLNKYFKGVTLRFHVSRPENVSFEI